MKRTILRRQRGTATLEAVLVVLTLTVIWMGLVHLGTKAIDEVTTRAKARECAFRVAMNACDEVPPSCKAAVAKGASSSKSDALDESGRKASSGSQVAEAFQQILMKQIQALFGERVRVSVTSEERRAPAPLGGKVTTTTNGYQLPCNTKPVDVGDLAKDAFQSLKGDR